MSGTKEILHLENCIASKLWFTSLIVHEASSNYATSEKDKDVTDFSRSEFLIRNVFDSQSEEHCWITHTLLSKLIASKLPNAKQNVEKRFNYIQMSHALQLCKSLPSHLRKELQSLYEITDEAKLSEAFHNVWRESYTYFKENINSNPNLICWIINELLHTYQNVLPNVEKQIYDLYACIMKTYLDNASLCDPATNYFGSFLCVVSKLAIAEYRIEEFANCFYSNLMKIPEQKDLQLCIFSNKDKNIFKRWCAFLDEQYAHYKTPNSTRDVDMIYQALCQIKNDSSIILNKNNLLQRLMKAETLWLVDLLSICYHFLNTGKYNEVSLILSSPLLKQLWPVLLFHFLNKGAFNDANSSDLGETSVAICDSIKFIIKRCEFDTSQDQALQQLNTILKNYIRISDYIINWRKSNPSKSTCNVKPIFSFLCHSNVLFILKATTNLHEQEYEPIKNLLIELNISKHTFQAYFCILNVLKAISYCEFYDTNYSQITALFCEMKQLIQTLYPLKLRVEVMQNIFALLFLQYEDFDNYQNLDGENISTSDEKSKQEDRQVDQSVAGFICNKYAIRDIILHLKDCIIATQHEFEKQKDIGHANEIDKNIEKDLILITAALKDAKWRLELHTNSDFTSGMESEDDEKETSFIGKKLEAFYGRSSRSPSKIKNPRFYREESTSEGTKTKTDSSSESGIITGSLKLKKKTKNLPIFTDPLMTNNISHKPILINLMLATNDSLVVQCLWKGDYEKAEQVIQMSDKKNAILNAEIWFSKSLRTFKECLCKSINVSKSQNVPMKNTESSILDNIRLAAKEGVQSSRYTNQLETFLASQESHLQMLVGENLNRDETLTLCVLDLALTASRDCTVSNNLCDVAMKYLRLSKTFDNTEHGRFFYKIYQLLHENKDESCLANLLCDSKIPLSAKEYKEKSNFWHDIMNKHFEFIQSQANKDTINEILKDNSDLPGLKILEKTVAVFGSSVLVPYMQCITTHLQVLHNIIPADNGILTVSDMLRVSLHQYLGHQMFDLEVEPHELESIAQSLRVNLAYSILLNTCPKLEHSARSRFKDNKIDGGCFVLNKIHGNSSPSTIAENPNQCVSEILTELLEALEKLFPDQSSIPLSFCKTLAADPSIQNILKKTSKLVHLDLSDLSVGDETLTFFVNTWNIMYLHAMLVLWSYDTPLDKLQHSVSLMSAGYVIGDLGLVTLSALRTKLAGSILSDDTTFIHTEELNEPAWQDLDITYDPRIIFVMANEFYGSPCIRVCNASTLNDHLNEALEAYIKYYSSDQFITFTLNSDKGKRITMPDLIRRCQKSIQQDYENVSNATSQNEKAFSLEDLLSNINQNLLVEYAPLSYSYDIVMNYKHYIPTSLQKKGITRLESWQNHTLRPSLLQYLDGHCWVLSYILQRMYSKSSTIVETLGSQSKRTACLEHILNSLWIAKTKVLYDDNETLAVICDTIPSKKMWTFFASTLDAGQLHDCLDLINSLPDSLLVNAEMQCLKDKVLSRIASNKDIAAGLDVLRYLYQIKDIHVLVQTILQNISKWQVQTCQDALLHALHHKDCNVLPAHCKLRMKETLRRVLVFHKMLPYCVSKSSSTWYDVAYCTNKIEPFQIINSLINADKFELCLEWLECQSFSLEISSVTQDFLIGLLKNQSQNFKHALKLLRVLPLAQSVKMCKIVLKKLESIDALQFIANYLLEHSRATETIKYRRTLLGIEILRMLEEKEQSMYIRLIKDPLLMLEQLLMNCKFESLQKILNEIHDKLQQVDISISTFDKTIRFYAQRSLDFRVSLQRDGMEIKPKTTQPSNLEAESTEFIMPAVVPTKAEWIPNEKARECSCCKTVIFSMFNRRHHCRRCGRVICAMCSQHRMHVSGYPQSVPVRVCDDCKKQTVLQMQAMQGTPSTPSSEVFDYWRLTKDETHNQTIREEFSFEYAPNISLCLAILNLHSDHKAYMSFLFDRCDEMNSLMQPVSGGKVNPEVDHVVIIKMIRSLLIAAKVKCAKLGLNTGLAHCDRFLSQVDLTATLVESGCLDLIPTGNLDEHALRRLRDLLIEREQWKLALDVSTKAGIDTQGVWATWGKACLKMGYFDQAREKFFHCLDKITHEDLDDWVVFSYSKDSPSSSVEKDGINRETKLEDSGAKKSDISKNRPLKDPPLLTEILQILDSLSVHCQYVQNSVHTKPSTAQEILNTFGNLKISAHGQFSRRTSDATQNVYYQESLYYLLTYGSYTSALDFFLKHEEFDKCLAFVLENDLDPETFFNSVYLSCLRNGCVDKLHEAMKNRDASLLTWKKYLIPVCYNLERRQYLYILYQVQLFMKDSIRAAMTCIRFYVNEATDYTDLSSRSGLLVEAQKHLETELQIEMLNKRRRKSTISLHSGQGILTMEMEPLEIDRHMNTISRQMEIAKFLAGCEKEERAPAEVLSLFPNLECDAGQTQELPTLFGNQQQKVHLAVLAILCGRDIGEGFGIAFRIMQDYNLPLQRVYSLAGHVLALQNNISAIEQLIKCCHTSGTPTSHVISDYVLTHCIKLLLNHSHSKTSIPMNEIDRLIRLITDIELKINAYIESKQLKAAYLLAVKRSRAQDIRKILKEADRLGQNAIKAICIKWLQQETKTRSS